MGVLVVLAGWSGSVEVENTIMAFNLEGPSVSGQGLDLSCCDLFGNKGGNWVGSIADQLGVNGNIAADPLFCDPEADILTLDRDSPCAPGQSGCGLMGAWDVGCGTTPAEGRTWGAIKALYRGE
jgi:hypothetical protein